MVNPFKRITDLLFISDLMTKYGFSYPDVKEAFRLLYTKRSVKYFRKMAREMKGLGELMEPTT